MIFTKRYLLVFGVALVAMLFINGGNSTTYSQTTTSVDSMAIVTRYHHFQEALFARDTMSIGDFYANDAVSLLQNQPMRQGRQAIATRWAKVLSGPFIFRIISPELNVSSSGGDAFQFGEFEIHSADTTNALVASGKVMFVWRKQVDQWRVVLEMDNFDRSPTSAKQ